MEELYFEKLRKTQLEILRFLKKICMENNINYFLDSGTLIGAVRHGGFIPWDDDIDIGMARSEYERLIKIWKETYEDEKISYYLKCKEIDKTCAMPFAKLCKKNTKIVEHETNGSSGTHGISIDIFPFDDIPEKESFSFGIRLRIAKFLVVVSLYKNGYKGFKNRFRKILCGSFSWLPYHVINLFQYNTYTKYNNQMKKEMACYIFSRGYKSCHGDKEKVFGKGNEIEFEGEMFSCPVDYDTYLRTQYGDYMKLPPKENQKSNHRILEIDFGDGTKWRSQND